MPSTSEPTRPLKRSTMPLVCGEYGLVCRYSAPSSAHTLAKAAVKQLPKLHVGGREFRKRHLYIAIDRRSRSVHLAVKEDLTAPSATAGLRRPRQCLL